MSSSIMANHFSPAKLCPAASRSFSRQPTALSYPGKHNVQRSYSTVVDFTPRTSFPSLRSLPRSYFLGHHKAGLDKIKTLLNQIDLVIECRDYRIPLTSRNALLEDSLKGLERIIVYTKRDLGVDLPASGSRHGPSPSSKKYEEVIRRWHAPSLTHFSANNVPRTAGSLISILKTHAQDRFALTGTRVLVAGMPNVGKSTLLNALRAAGVRKGKVAHTGANPGVTRRVGSAVKIIEGEAIEAGGAAEGVYILDTPGVFVPYVPDAEAMLKLALCGCVKDNIVPPLVLADYLLYRLNLHDPGLYAEYTGNKPTNEIVELLQAIARQTGRLTRVRRDQVVVSSNSQDQTDDEMEDVWDAPSSTTEDRVEGFDLEATALWLVQRWRGGHLGRFVLDEVDEGALDRMKREESSRGPSMSQAKKMEKEGRREKAREKARGLGRL